MPSSPSRTRSPSRISKRKRNPGTTALLTGHDAILPSEPSLTQRFTSWLTPSSSPTPSGTSSIPPSGVERTKERGVRGASPAPSISNLGCLGDLEDGGIDRGRKKGKKERKGKGKESDGELNLLAGPTFIEDESQLERARNMVCATPIERTSQTPKIPEPQQNYKQAKRKKRSVWNFFFRRCDQDGGLGPKPKGGQILVDECSDDFLLVIVKSTEIPDENGTRNTPTQQSTSIEYRMEESQRELTPLPIPQPKEPNERSRKRPGLQICIPSAPTSKKRSFSVSKQHRSSTSRSLAKVFRQQSVASDHVRESHSLNGRYLFQRRQTDTDIHEELQQAMEASLPKLPWCFPLSGPGTPLHVHSEETHAVGEESRWEGVSELRNSILTPGVLNPTISQSPPPSSLPDTHVTTEDDYFGLDAILSNREAQDLEATRREEVAEIEEILGALDEPPVQWDVSGASIPVGEKYLRALESGRIDEASLISDPVGSENGYLLAPVSSPVEQREGWVPEGYSETEEDDSRVDVSSTVDENGDYKEEKHEEDEYGVESQSLSTRFLKEDSLQFAMEQFLASRDKRDLGGSYVRLCEDPSSPTSTQSSNFSPPTYKNTARPISPTNSSPLILPNSFSARRTLIQPLLKPTPRNPNNQSLTTPQPESRGPSPKRLPTSCSLENSIISTTYSSGPEREWWYGSTPPPSSPQPVPRTWMEMPIPTSTLSLRIHIRGGYGHSPPPSASTPGTESDEETHALPPPLYQSATPLRLRGGGPPSFRKKTSLSLFSISIPEPCAERGKKLLDKQVGLPFYILGGAPGRSMTHRSFIKLAKERVDKQKSIDAEKEEKRKKRCDAQDKIAELKEQIANLEVEGGVGVGNRVKEFLKSDTAKPVEKKGKGEKKAEEPVMSGGNGETTGGDSGEASGEGGGVAAAAPETPAAPEG